MSDETVLGFKILKASDWTDNMSAGLRIRRIVLVDRGEEYTDRYVTWKQYYPEMDVGLGRYMIDKDEAEEDYNERVAQDSMYR